MKKYVPQQKGFVILFTILISTIILMIGLGIFSIATRETVLSGTAREAQYAFYAADAGVECALYAQNLGINGPIAPGSNGGVLTCGEIPVSVIGGGVYPGNPFIFNIVVDADQKTCATVTIFDTTTSSGAYARRVISQGYNVCDSTTGKPLTKNPILVERDLDTTYELGVGQVLVPGAPAPVKNPGSLGPLPSSILSGVTPVTP